jgi:two-component sensor histidine kinase
MKSLVEEKNQLLADKKDLAAELQHRVRNNLHLVLAMLEKQIIEANDGLIKKEGIEAIARRVMTLAKVYDHLLGHDMSRSIEFGAYVTSLCGSLRDFQFGQTANTITLTCHAKDRAILSLDAATALGIVVTEVVSNSYLHAFSESKGGKINISLRRSKDGSATLVVSDNGKGFKVVEGSKRHGVGLIRRLTEQAGGTVKLSSNRGTKWKLTFPTLTR